MSSEAQAAKPATSSESKARQLLARGLRSPLVQRVVAWPQALQATLASVVLGALVLVPYLGAVGLWDCWETHYGEVAREMIQRNDYVHPWWENAWFFSKPVFTMWMQAVGMHAADAGVALPLMAGVLFLGVGVGLFLRVAPQRKSAELEFWGVLAAFVGLLGLALGVWALTVRLPWRVASIAGGDGALPILTEWGFRLPFAGFSIVALALLTYAISRIVGPRAGLATAFALVTMPLYFLLSRQAVTDTPIVSATVSGIACALVGLFDGASRRKTAWWYAAYLFFAIATLAKGWLGFLVPSAVFGLYVLLEVIEYDRPVDHLRWLWRVMGTPLLLGLAAGLVVGLVAYRVGLDRGTTFLSGPPRGTGTPGQGNDYLGAAHWLGITWGLLAAWATTTFAAGPALRREPERPPRLFELLTEMRLGTGILLFLAVALPWYYEMFTFWRLDDESKLFWFRFVVHDHLSRFFSGVHTTTPGGSFTYFIEQGGYAIFPWVLLLPGAVAVVGRARLRSGNPVDAVGLIAVLWAAISWFAVGGSETKFHHYVFAMLPPVAILIGRFVDRLWDEGLDAHVVVLLVGVPLFLLVGKDLWTNPKNFTDLFVYNYDRPYPAFLVTDPSVGPYSIRSLLKLGLGSSVVLAVGFAFWRARAAVAVAGACAVVLLFALWFGWAPWENLLAVNVIQPYNIKSLLKLGTLAGFGLCVVFAFWRWKAAVFTAGLGSVLAFALWFNWSHWVDLSHHWTQRDQFWRYYSQRRPGEPIAAFLMNWRGETFYSRNTVKQIKDNANVGMAAYAQQPGRKWSLVEHNRLGILRSAAGRKRITSIDADLNNKFVLVTIDD